MTFSKFDMFKNSILNDDSSDLRELYQCFEPIEIEHDLYAVLDGTAENVPPLEVHARWFQMLGRIEGMMNMHMLLALEMDDALLGCSEIIGTRVQELFLKYRDEVIEMDQHLTKYQERFAEASATLMMQIHHPGEMK